MNLEKRKQEIKVRLNEIKGLAGVEATLEVLEDLEKEIDELKEEEETIDRKLAIQRKAVINPIQVERTDMVNKRSEEHTSELQSRPHLVCRLLLEKKK